MKANEFRIGNLVNCKNQTVAIKCITEFGLEYSNADWWDGDIEDINGIPLTEEWFLKFGFKKEGEYFYIPILDYRYCFKFAVHRNDWGFYIEYTDSPDIRDDGKKYFFGCGNINYKEGSFGLHYVHQLQNLYFALTGVDLKIK